MGGWGGVGLANLFHHDSLVLSVPSLGPKETVPVCVCVCVQVLEVCLNVQYGYTEGR